MIDNIKRKVLEIFAEGRRKYKLMKFKEAMTYFEEALKLDPNDGPSKIYFKRCEEYIKEPPADDWDGVYVMKTK